MCLPFERSPSPVERVDGRELLLGSSQSSLELIHATADIDELLLAGGEGVALGANFHANLGALGGAGGHGCAASALNDALVVLRMDAVFHFFLPHFEISHML